MSKEQKQTKSLSLSGEVVEVLSTPVGSYTLIRVIDETQREKYHNAVNFAVQGFIANPGASVKITLEV